MQSVCANGTCHIYTQWDSPCGAMPLCYNASDFGQVLDRTLTNHSTTEVVANIKDTLKIKDCRLDNHQIEMT
eukprot:2545702-Amphidinium_carterae.1